MRRPYFTLYNIIQVTLKSEEIMEVIFTGMFTFQDFVQIKYIM